MIETLRKLVIAALVVALAPLLACADDAGDSADGGADAAADVTADARPDTGGEGAAADVGADAVVDARSEGGGDVGAGLSWYETCGDPVCRSDDAGAGVDTPRCTTERKGGACGQRGALCDPGTGCGVKLICTDVDPRTGPGGCPIALIAGAGAAGSWHRSDNGPPRR